MVHLRLGSSRVECFLTWVATIYEHLLCYHSKEFESFEPPLLDEGDEELPALPEVEDLVLDVQIELEQSVTKEVLRDSLS